jgi:hypothetical protein
LFVDVRLQSAARVFTSEHTEKALAFTAVNRVSKVFECHKGEAGGLPKRIVAIRAARISPNHLFIAFH